MTSKFSSKHGFLSFLLTQATLEAERARTAQLKFADTYLTAITRGGDLPTPTFEEASLLAACLGLKTLFSGATSLLYEDCPRILCCLNTAPPSAHLRSRVRLLDLEDLTLPTYIERVAQILDNTPLEGPLGGEIPPGFVQPNHFSTWWLGILQKLASAHPAWVETS